MVSRALLTLVVLIGLLGLGLWLARTEIAQRLAIAALEREGLGPAVLMVEDLGFSRGRATGIAIGPEGGIHAESLEIDYSLRGLFSGQVEALRIEGLRAQGTLDEEGNFSVPALDPVLGDGSGDGSAIPALPFDQIELRDFAFSLETSGEPAVIAGDALLRQTGPDSVDFSIELSDLHREWDERVSLSGTVRGAENGTIGLDARMEGTIAAMDANLSFDAKVTGAMADGDLSAKAVFSRLDAKSAVFQAEGMVGEIAYEATGDMAQTISMELNIAEALLLGQSVGPGNITARRDGTRIAVTASLDSEAGHFALDAEGDPDDPAEPLTFTLDGALDPALLATLLDMPVAPAGAIMVAANGSLSTPNDFASGDAPDLATLLKALRMAATISPHLTDLNLPGMFKAASLSGEASLSVGEQDIALSFLPGFGLTGLTIDRALADQLPPDIAESLALGSEREIVVAGDAPLRLTLAPTDAGYTVTAAGEVASHGAAPNSRLAIEGAMNLSADFAPHSIVAHALEASLTDLAYEGMAGTLDIRLGDIRSTEGVTTGGLALRLRGSGKPDPSIALAGAKIDLDGNFHYANGALTLTLDDSSRLNLADLRLDGDPIAIKPIALRVRSGEASTITARTSSPAGIAYDLRLAHADLELSLVDDDDPTIFAFDRGTMRIEGSSEAMTLGWKVTTGTIDDLPIAFEGLTLNATLHGLSGGLRGTARLRSSLRHVAEEAFVLPLSLVMDARLAAGRLSATAKLKDPSERIFVTGEARHNFASNSGEALFNARRIEFLETVFQPKDIFPVFANLDARVDGAIDLAGSASWTPGQFDSGMELALDFPSILSPEATLKDVAGVIVFDSLSHFTTPPDQMIAIGYADVGVPLEAGQLILHVKRGPIIRAEIQDFDLYGGRVFVDPVDYDPNDDQVSLVLGARGVRIEDMLAPARLGTLEATGVLDGYVPIIIRDGKLTVSGGVLESVGGGRIRYIPEEVGDAVREVDEGTALFLDAVSNFEYSLFRVTIDEDEDEEMVLEFEIDGRNPAVYEGVPIELHIAITGEVREVLYSGISTYELPQRIAAALEKFKE
ncbi:MAG: YdbH domain-containing protein [Proteobacteria bacterium]|nr:YdbH domain-containing protein [Pseudomonadota bacterium]